MLKRFLLLVGIGLVLFVVYLSFKPAPLVPKPAGPELVKLVRSSLNEGFSLKGEALALPGVGDDEHYTGHYVGSIVSNGDSDTLAVWFVLTSMLHSVNNAAYFVSGMGYSATTKVGAESSDIEAQVILEYLIRQLCSERGTDQEEGRCLMDMRSQIP